MTDKSAQTPTEFYPAQPSDLVGLWIVIRDRGYERVVQVLSARAVYRDGFDFATVTATPEDAYDLTLYTRGSHLDHIRIRGSVALASEQQVESWFAGAPDYETAPPNSKFRNFAIFGVVLLSLSFWSWTLNPIMGTIVTTVTLAVLTAASLAHRADLRELQAEADAVSATRTRDIERHLSFVED